jgi:hypothetical protein
MISSPNSTYPAPVVHEVHDDVWFEYISDESDRDKGKHIPLL